MSTESTALRAQSSGTICHMKTSGTFAWGSIHSVLLSKQRMEALTDGIFAIAMTLLVLELKVPDAPKSISGGELMQRLGEQIPAFFSFLVSFLYCGLLWTLHHLSVHFFRHIQTAMAWLNLIFLLAISLLPFSCALLGHFLSNPAAEEIYFGNMFAAALLLLVQWSVAKRKNLIKDDDPRAAKDMGLRLMFIPPALAAAMLVTPYKPLSGFYVLMVVMVALRVWQRRSSRRRMNEDSAKAGPS
jgi:uncharacterized membrane protein